MSALHIINALDVLDGASGIDPASVEEVFPAAFVPSQGEEGAVDRTMSRVDYATLVPLLVAAVQELMNLMVATEKETPAPKNKKPVRKHK